MPRASLAQAQHIFRRFCAVHQVSYLETRLIAAYAQALRYLDTVGRSPALSFAH